MKEHRLLALSVSDGMRRGQQRVPEYEIRHRVSADIFPAVQLKKLISASGFRLTGSGWYETDFKNSKSSTGSGGGSCGSGGCGCG